MDNNLINKNQESEVKQPEIKEQETKQPENQKANNGNEDDISDSLEKIANLTNKISEIITNDDKNGYNFTLEYIRFERELIRLEAYIIRYYSLYRIGDASSFKFLIDIINCINNVNRDWNSHTDKVKKIESLVRHIHII